MAHHGSKLTLISMAEELVVSCSFMLRNCILTFGYLLLGDNISINSFCFFMRLALTTVLLMFKIV